MYEYLFEKLRRSGGLRFFISGGQRSHFHKVRLFSALEVNRQAPKRRLNVGTITQK